MVEIINEDHPHPARVTISNKSPLISSRMYFLYTFVAFEIVFGIVLRVIFPAAAGRFAGRCTPVEGRVASVGYVRMGGFASLVSALETAFAFSVRTLTMWMCLLVVSLGKFLYRQ